MAIRYELVKDKEDIKTLHEAGMLYRLPGYWLAHESHLPRCTLEYNWINGPETIADKEQFFVMVEC